MSIFQKWVIGILVLQLFFIWGVYSNVNLMAGKHGTVSVYDRSTKKVCGSEKRDPCYVKVVR